MKRNNKGFTLVELLAVIVILGLLMAIAIPSVTKYITQSRKKTLISSVDSYVTAVTTAVNDNEFGALSKQDTMYYIPVSNNESESCVALEKGGSDPFGNWKEAYVVVNYDAEKYSYDYYFTFYDDAGYGMALTEISKIDANSNIITNPSPVNASNITTQKNDRAIYVKVLTAGDCKVANAVNGGAGGAVGGAGGSSDTTPPSVGNHAVTPSDFSITLSVDLTNLSSGDYPVTVEYYIRDKGDSSYILKHSAVLNSGTSTSYVYTGLRDRVEYDVKAIIKDKSGNRTEVIDSTMTYCFLAGTKVLTENGLMNIEDIKLGDKVYSLNTDTNVKELKEVTRLIRSRTTETYELTVGDSVIKTTPRHEFYIVDKGWIRAYELEVGDVLVSTTKGDMKITKIEHKYHDEEIPTYNLTVEDNHNYLITEDRLLVHNATSPTEGIIPEI